ncbi:SLC13 family permease [Campylobacter canadensis]|uniref:SLC13 family permease n=1 Tax=Campylobacter canadensis TaxID=449520 RepID=A0ABS7WRI9_9BACT|nr:SLC13 family permease [Campylobacter canadensis]MBZ7987375.1 SLC13 family permease [Campylobacter canadensis]MBZ7994742.1 SLC13 family permease [Campylobacter canadensis]MBZ7996550.1 SLC13 family permease [Campylobacter canadensis]MBZ7998454.1 SLC13 family permease [Campylobacter canadensis]MBZ8000168.1 SLC13 family permease [Campylobacter canadensis]
MLIFIVFCIFASIFLGYKFKINIGLFALAFSYIIACFGMNLSVKELLNMWPLSIFFVILSVCMFYNIASANLTLEKLANLILIKFQNHQRFLPFVIYFIASLIAALGAGFYSVLAFMAPLSFVLCDKLKLNKLICAMAINYGALSGANFVSSQSGIIFRNLMQDAGLSQNEAFINAFWIFFASFILPIFVLGIYTLFAKTQSVKITLHLNNISFDFKQKITLILMGLLIFIILLFPILNIIFQDNKTIAFLNKKIDIAFICIIFVIIALMLNLAEQNKIINLIPWQTLLMIVGVGMLISLAIKAGMTNELKSFVSNNINKNFIPLIMMIIAAFMSLFSSTLGVVAPALFVLVPDIASASGVNACIIFVCIIIGAQASAISPFSSGGSLILGSIKQEQKDLMLKELMFKAVPIGFFAAFILCFVLTLFI